MEHTILSEFGLAQNEIKIYEFLVTVSDATIDTIAKQTGIHKRNVYDSLQRLTERGLIYQIVTAKVKFYSATDPEKLNELVAEQKNSLQKIMPDLERLYSVPKETQRATLYLGEEGFRKYLTDILAQNKTVYAIGASASFYDERYAEIAQNFFNQAKQQKLPFQFLLEHKVKAIEKTFQQSFGSHHRYIPKKYETDSAVIIYGDKICLEPRAEFGNFPEEEPRFYIIEDARLAESYRTWFQLLWDLCKK